MAPGVRLSAQMALENSYQKENRAEMWAPFALLNAFLAYRQSRRQRHQRYRGRDTHCWMPPAQIPAGVFHAPGSHLGYLTAKRSLGQG